MCLIVYNKDGKKLNKESMQAAHTRNNDGCGVTWVENGKVKITKGMFDFESFWEFLTKLEGIRHAIHFRSATQGPANMENSHPYIIIPGKLVVMHNGILSNFDDDRTKSDTRLFAESLTAKIKNGTLTPESFFDEHIIKELDKSLGWNKLLFLNNKNEVAIVNENSGTWIDGIWYSNTYSINAPYTSYSYYTPPKKIEPYVVTEAKLNDEEEKENEDIKHTILSLRKMIVEHVRNKHCVIATSRTSSSAIQNHYLASSDDDDDVFSPLRTNAAIKAVSDDNDDDDDKWSDVDKFINEMSEEAIEKSFKEAEEKEIEFDVEIGEIGGEG